MENGKGKTLLKIQSYFISLTRAERIVAEYVMKFPNDIIYYSVTELAEKSNVSETTVLRFCKKIQFMGFQDFKLSLAKDLADSNLNLYETIMENDDAHTLIKKVTSSHERISKETSDLLDPNKLQQAIDLLIDADEIHFFGVGSSGLSAQQSAHSFTRIGKKSEAKVDAHFQAISASLLTPKDVVVGFSVSGSSKDTAHNLRIAKKTGAKIICITHNARSPITKLADVDLLMASWENPLQGSSLSAKISQLAIVDILCMGVFIRMKERAKEYRRQTANAVSAKLY